MTPLRGHLCRGIGGFDKDLLDSAKTSAGRNAPFMFPPISGGRSRPTNRLFRPGPASPAPGPPRDGQTADCGESAPRSRRSWHRPPARRGSAVPTAGAPAGWSKDSPQDGAANQGPGSGTHSVGFAGISRPPRPGRPGRYEPANPPLNGPQVRLAGYYLRSTTTPRYLGRLLSSLLRRCGMASVSRRA